MANFKKTLDRRKRKSQKPDSQLKRAKRVAKKEIGRPKANREQLFQDRDAILQLLSSNWDRIGWRLSRARSPEQLRKALHLLKRDSSLGLWVASFLRGSVEKATAVQIRKTGRAIYQELKNNREAQEKYNALLWRYNEAENAFELASAETKRSITLELKKRGNEFDEYEHAWFASNFRMQDLEKKLADQRAFFVQSELLKFRRRGYAHNPKVLADAMAGLPEIGCRQSHLLCSKTDSLLWPSHPFELFKFIQSTWERRDLGPNGNTVDLFRESIRELPHTVRVEKEVALRYQLKTKVRDNYLRASLCRDWRYLRLAIDQVSRRKIHPRIVPYLIMSRLRENTRKARTAEDVVLAEMEMLKD